MKVVISLFVFMLLLLALAIGGIAHFTNSLSENSPVDVPTQESPEITSKNTPPTDWVSKTFNDFTLSHPPNAEFAENQDTLRILLIGPDQTEGTELFDGLSMEFTIGETDNFREYVENIREEASKDPAIESVSNIKKIKLGSLTGLSFNVVGLGEFEHIYLEISNNQFLHISSIMADSSNSGFIGIKDKILQSITHSPAN